MKLIFKLLERFIQVLEKPRFNLLHIFLIIFSISLFRIGFETLLLNTHLSIYDYAHQLSFLFFAFIGGLLILKIVTKEKVGKVVHVVSFGFLLVPMAPILDRFIFHRTFGYDYVHGLSFQEGILPFFQEFNRFAGFGAMIILCSILVLSSLYIYMKTYSLSRTITGFFSLSFFMFILGTWPNFIHISVASQSAGQLFAFLLYFLLISVCIIFILKTSKKGLLINLIRSLRLFPTLIFIILVLSGIVIPGTFSLEYVLPPPITLGFCIICISVLAVVFMCWYSIMVNHIYDIKIDRISNPQRVLPSGMLTIDQGKRVAVLFAILSVGFSSLLGIPFTLLAGVALVLGFIYSAPPIRIRNRIFSTFMIGLGCASAFLWGYLVPSAYVLDYVVIWQSITSVSFDVLSIAIVIFIAFSVGPVIKDLKDFESDRRKDVKNIFTVFGMEKGLDIASILLFMSFFSPILLFHTVLDFLVLLPLAAVAVFIFRKFENMNFVIGLSFPILIYCFSRLVGLL